MNSRSQSGSSRHTSTTREEDTIETSITPDPMLSTTGNIEPDDQLIEESDDVDIPLDGHMRQVLGDHSVSQNVDHSVSQNVDHSLSHNVDHSLSHNVDHSLSQNVDHSLSQNGTVVPQVSEQTDTWRNVNNEWRSSPYTRNPTRLGNSSVEPNTDSVYSIEFQKPGRPIPGRPSSREGGNRIGIISPSDVDPDGDEAGHVFTPRHVLANQPPIGHHGDFYGVAPRKHKKGLFAKWNESGDNNGLYEENMSVMDDSTVFGKAFSALGFNKSSSLTNKDTRKQARNALKLADSLTSVPLSKVWHVFTEVFNNLLFILNIAVAIADIARGPTYLYYKVTALILGVIENLITFIMWAIKRHPKFKNSEKKEKFEKYQQYTENIVSEILIYPLLILSILGFTTEKMYQKQDAFGWVQLALIIFDTIVLIYNQIVRLHMLRRVMKDLHGVIHTGGEKHKSSWNVAGSILPRLYYTVISNFLVILGLTCMFGIQSNRDNYTSSDYSLSLASGLVMLLLLLLPALSLVLFFAVNLYWVMEMLMKINYVIGSSDEFQEKIRKSYGDSLAEAVHFSRSKIPSNEKKLEDVQKTKFASKLLYCLHEIPFLFLIFTWQCLIIATVYCFDGFEDTSLNMGIKMAFLCLIIIANPHVTLLMVLSNFMVLALILGVIIYPLCLPLCCKKQYKVQSKYSQLMSQGETND